MTDDYPNHCGECGAWLANNDDIAKHAAWHQNLIVALADLTVTANHADAFHRLYKGKPA